MESTFLRTTTLMPTDRPTDAEIDQLRHLVQMFTRRFGLLLTKQTPCGHPVSPTHAHALMILLDRTRRNERTPQADLGNELGIDKSNVARLCSKMEGEGHVAQDRDPEDGRSRLLRLTSAGTRLAQGIERASRDRFRRVVRAVPPEERSALFASLEVLNGAVETLATGEDES